MSLQDARQRNIEVKRLIAEAIKPHKTVHHSRLTSQQLPKLLQDINAYEGDVLVRLGLWFMCYTFVRTSELRFME